MIRDEYDVIVVGAGAGGGIAACVLAEAGLQVLLLERGSELTIADVGRDHLRNQRISLYGHNAGPQPGDLRTFAEAGSEMRVLQPWEPNYHNNAACVGGGTRVYGAQAWRFMEQDFRMASLYGVPEQSSLADWPLDYAELEPFYERAEWELGVCGHDTANVHQAQRRRGYPMPPMSETRPARILKNAADALGWQSAPVPLLINSAHYQGRDACVRCQMCVGFACPSNSKNGTQNTVIPRALATGCCTLLTGAMAAEIEIDGTGEAKGIALLVEENGSRVRKSVRARAVVLSCGAIETARLLLASQSEMHPHGIGNQHDIVGRNLQGHYYPGSLGTFEEVVYDGVGPGPSISTCQFNHGNPGIVGGGMLANEFIKLPIIHYSWALPPGVPRWGRANKEWMRRSYTRTIHIMGPVQDIPHPNARVTINSAVRDRYGLPVAHLSGATHTETLRTAQFMWERSRQWLEAAGASAIYGARPAGLGLSGGQHQAGTCRMGNDPLTSVTDRWGRVHGQQRLFVMDASLHVTNGGFNPVLTVMALAFRNAEHMAAGLRSAH